MLYIASLAAPIFFGLALIVSAGSGIDEATEALNYNIRDNVDLGFLNTVTEVIDVLIDVLVSALRGVMYLMLVILVDIFIAGVKIQATGGIMSMIWLVSLVNLLCNRYI